MDHTHVRRACCTAIDGTGAEAFLFMLRNCLGTSNVPNLLCRAKTLWSCAEGDAGVLAESRVRRWCAEMGREGRDENGLWPSSLCLLGPLADRTFRHCHPHALLLSVGHVES
eukprot:scaffold36015_cov68-Phaeocystis_antarctica.AAC.3